MKTNLSTHRPPFPWERGGLRMQVTKWVYDFEMEFLDLLDELYQTGVINKKLVTLLSVEVLGDEK